MSHTNSTTNYSLPQFLTTDKPAWLTDVNNAYLAIDTAMKNNANAASAAQGDATQALTDAGNADTKATTAKNTADGAIASISDAFSSASAYSVGDYVIYNNLLYKCTTAITTPGDWTGSANWERVTIEEILATKANTSSLATVATTGSFNDLSNKPTTINYANTVVKTPNAQGLIEFSLTEIGCTSVPKCIIVTMQSDGFIVRYNYDHSLQVNKAVIMLYRNDGVLVTSGTFRFCMVVIQ